MALVEYGSESESEVSSPPSAPRPQTTPTAPQKISPPFNQPVKSTAHEPAPPPEDAPLVGPFRPPAASPSPSPEDTSPLSPYSSNRNLIHTLTIPPSIPSIPNSPPGSPPPSIAGKFSHFRQLKTQGLHYNEKLLHSSPLRNPNLLEKLMTYVGFEEGDQYASNLPQELWNPRGFKNEGFVDELAASQVKIQEERQKAQLDGRRDVVEFVESVQTLPAPVARRTESKVERIMSGLDREKNNAPSLGMRGGRRERDDRRGGSGRREEREWEGERERERKHDDAYRDRKRDDDRNRRRRSGSRE